MVERTVTTRLRLDSSQWVAGQNAAVNSNNRLAASATAAATTAQRDADRTAAAVAGTFRGMARTGEAAIRGLDAAAMASSQTLARSTTAITRQMAASASTLTATTRASATATAATTRAAASTTAATTRISAAAGTIPPAFRAAAAGATSALAGLDVTNANSRREVARTLIAQRQASTAAAAAITQTSTTMSAATAAAAAGTNRLSLASRLALAEGAQASQTAAAATVASVTRLTTAQSLAARGAGSAAAAAAAATARADASATALAGTFGSAAARARTMGSAIVTSAGGAERSLKATRVGAIALVAAFGLAVYASSKFETAMSAVKAATQAGTKELGLLRQAAIQAGATTQYSATQAANAETELAKAGVSTADILGGALKGTLNLAAAGQMDVGDSAVVAAKAMNSFGLSGKDMAHIADVIAAAAGKSATDVHGLSLAFAQSSLLAHQTGLSLEQTAGALALFAQNGLVGSDAGTSLKTMLMRLTPQSQQAADMMDQLGFSAYDSSGKFIGWSATAAALQKSLANLTPEARNTALGVMFGSDAIRAATIVSKAGAEGVDTWTRAANDQGYAARYAATQTDNLAGDLQRLKSALETALIQSGSAANGVLRDMAKQLTEVVRWYSNLSPSVQKDVTILGGFLGMVGLVATSLLLLLPRIMTVRTELVALGLTAERTKVLMSGLGRLALVVGMLTAISYATDKISKSMAATPPSVTKLTDSLIDLAQTGKASGEVAKSFGDDLDGFGAAVHRIAHAGGLTAVTDEMQKLPLIGGKSGGLQKATDQLKSTDEALAELVKNGNADLATQSFKDLSAAAEKHGTSTKKLLTMLPKYSDALTGADTQQKLTAASQKQLGDESETTADDLADTRTEAQKLSDTLDQLNGANIDVAESEISFRQSLADLRETVKKNGTTLDITTDKGRKVKSAFLDAAQGVMKHAEAVATQTGSQEKGNKVLVDDIGLLKNQMVQMGFNKDKVNELLAAYASLPAQAKTILTAENAGKTLADLKAIEKQVKKVPAGHTITIKAPSAAVLQALRDMGFKVKTLPDKSVRVTIPTGGPKAAIASIKAYLATLQDKTITLTTEHRAINTGKGGRGPNAGFANGGVVSHAANGLFVPGYAPRQDTVPAMLSPGEGVLVPETVRALGGAKAIAMLNAWGRYGSASHFAAGGTVQRFASGGVSYTPTASPTLGGTTNAMDRYNAANDKLKAVWATFTKTLADATKKTAALRDAESNLNRVRGGHHTATQLAAAEKKLRDARAASSTANKAVTKARSGVYSADAALGVAKGAQAPGFSLAGYQKQLTASVAATAAWRASLKTIATRGGQEVADILAGMGEDGYALVQSLGKASNAQFTDITKKLLATAGVAKASLADFDAQVNASTKVNAQFAADLQKLAGEGYGDLAQALAAQGDTAAQALAHQAVGSSAAASAANAAVKGSAATMSGDDLANSLVLLSTLRGGQGRGFADLVGAGLDVATIKALVPRLMAQIQALPAAYRTAFLQQWAGQSGAVAMARGGILTQPTAVVAAEAGATESWIPWNGSARSAALLARTAAAQGYQLVPAGRWGSSSGSAGGATHVDRSQSIHLHGAQQSLGEQRADLLRHMTVLA